MRSRLIALCALLAAPSVAARSELTVAPAGDHRVHDAAAADGLAVALYAPDDRATFTVPASAAPGTYRLSVRVRAAPHRGWPLLQLSLAGDVLDEVRVQSDVYVVVALGGPVALRPGDVVAAQLLAGRRGTRDRALFLDHLTLTLETPARGGRAVARGPSRPVLPIHVGVNIDRTIRGLARDDAAYNAALGALRPGTIRFPGGTVSNYWDWERADFVCGVGERYFVRNSLGQATSQPCELPNGYQALDPPRHTLEAFKTELERTGAEAVFVLNLLTERAEGDSAAANDARRIERQLAMLREAARIGIAVRHVELGNELYLAAGARDASNDYITAYPNPGAYARQARRWIAAVKAEFPEARVAAVGANTVGGGSPRRQAWNETLLAETGDRLEAVTLHTYVKTADHPKADSTDVPAFLAMAEAVMDTLLAGDLAGWPDTVDVWASEYNTFAEDMRVHGTWAHGLFVAAQTLGFLRAGGVTLSHVHSGIGGADFGALFFDERGFALSSWPAPVGGARPATVRLGKSAAGETLELVGEAFRGATSAAPLAFGDDAPTLPGGSAALVGWEARDSGGARLVLLNLGAEAQSLDLSAVATTGEVVQRATAPLTLVTGAGLAEAVAPLDGPLELPAYSATLVRPAPPPPAQTAGTGAVPTGAVPAGLAISPNPVRRKAAVTYVLDESGAVRLTVYDLLGRAVATLADGTVSAGRHRTSLDAAALAPGPYVVRLEAAGTAVARRLTVVR